MYYSQHGEDFLLEKIFPKNKGFFVEVGCVDGKRFSNTLHFESKGWKGMNIEAHADYISLLEKNRPNSINVHAAVCDEDGGEITFFADRRGSLSTLDKTRETELKRDYADFFSGFKEQIVPKRTITSLFDEYDVKDIDFVSIDIEGGEFPALKGFDLNKYKPTVLLIEFGSLSDLSELKKILSKFGYKLELILKNNAFFSLNSDLFKSIKNTKFDNVELTHTGNPIDSEEDVVTKVNISTKFLNQLYTRWKFVEKKIRHFVKDILRKYD